MARADPAFMVINLPLMVPEIITAVAMLSSSRWSPDRSANFGLGNLIAGPHGLLHPLRLYADPGPARGHGPDAGAGGGRSLRHALERLPAHHPAAAVARHPGRPMLAFVVSFDDFAITQLVAGPGQTTLPLYIWTRSGGR